MSFLQTINPNFFFFFTFRLYVKKDMIIQRKQNTMIKTPFLIKVKQEQTKELISLLQN